MNSFVSSAAALALASLAMPAAALLLTPALQKKTTSFPVGGFWNPNWSSNSEGERRSASGWEVMGRLMAVGMVSALYSCGSRTSMRRREDDGFSRMERTYNTYVRWEARTASHREREA